MSDQVSDDMRKGIPSQHTEDRGYAPTPAKRAFGPKVRNHYRRFWWVHVIITIVLVLVITLPLVLVGFPNIAQHAVNEATLNITSMSILDPTPDSFDLELTSVLTNPSIYHPNLGAFNGSLHLDGSDTAFAYINVPGTPADSGAQSHIKQTVQIANMEQYTDFAKTVLGAKSYVIVLKGRGGLHEGGLPTTNVNYNKKITLAGLNGLAGFSILDFSILLKPLPNGANMNGTVLLPNPTVMTVAMGNVTLDLSVAGTPIGVSTLPNLVLHPGNNTVPMFATMDQTKVIGLISKYPSGMLPVDIVGNGTTYNGVDLPYYDAALKSNKLSVMLDVKEALTKIGLGSVFGSGNGTESS